MVVKYRARFLSSSLVRKGTDVVENHTGFVVSSLLKVDFGHLQLGRGRLIRLTLEFGEFLEFAFVVTIELSL